MKKVFKKIIDKKNKEVFIVVEMSGNHQNSLSKASEFVNKAIINGADIIKFQVYKPETITLKSNKNDFLRKNPNEWASFKNLFDFYQKAHTPWDWIEKITKKLNANKFPWFGSVFDSTSVDFLEKLKCPAYKIASPEITDIDLIRKVAATRKPVIISTGLANLKDVDLAVKTIKKYHSKFAILKCTTAYPTPLNELNLKAINLLKKRYGCSVGFSDHSLGLSAIKAAVSLGATIIEKHFKLDDDKISIDAGFSLELSKLKNLKEELNEISVSLGKESLEISKSSKNNMSGRRSLYISADIKIGEKFTFNNIKSVRPSFGMKPKHLSRVIGKKSKVNIKAGSRLLKKMVKNF